MDDGLVCLPDPIDAIATAIAAGIAEMLTVSGGVAFAFGEVGYLFTDGTVRKAKSAGTAAEAEAAVICIAPAGVASGSAGAFAYESVVTFGSAVGTVGLAYLSPTAGGITATLPVSPTATYSKIIGRWRTTTVLWFCPSPEIAPFVL